MTDRPPDVERQSTSEAADTDVDPGGGPSHSHAGELGTHATFMLDQEGDIMSWSEPAQTLYGYDPETVRNRSMTVLIAEDELDDISLAELLDSARDGSHEMSIWHRQADGETFRATTTLVPLWNDRLHGYAVVNHGTAPGSQEEGQLQRQHDRLKEFTDTLTHDLRNPLSIVRTRLELYRETGDASHLDAITETVSRMEDLIDDVLQVAQHDTMVTDPEPVAIAPIIETAWDGTGQQVPGATIETQPVGTVRADTTRLCQLLENLFRNAVEHSSGDVTVSVGPLEAGFYVEDTGPGIPDTVRETLFDHGVTTASDGTGYGLSIVQTITDAHGWNVAVSTEATGGARFEITDIELVE